MVTTTRPLRKYTKKSRKPRTATTTLVKYQKPNARNQRTQIMRNARDVKKLYRAVMGQRVYCDWQYQRGLKADPTVLPAPASLTWGCFPLTDYSSWSSVLRKDINVNQSTTTYVRNMTLNLRYQLGGSDYAQYNVWIVTSRKDASNIDWPSQITAGTDPVVGDDYIEGIAGFNLRLNPAKFKVHFASYKTLTESTLFSAALAPAGNPMTTFSKGQANVKCGIKVRLPTIGASSTSWRDLPYMQQAYYSRYFMLVAITQNNQTGAARTASFTVDQLATTINDT